MAQVRFLDQVPVGVYNPNGKGGGGSVDIYYTGSLVLPSVPFINFTGSVNTYTEIISGSQGVTVLVTSAAGFPFSGSAVITGSLEIINPEYATVFSASADTLIFTGSIYSTGTISLIGSMDVTNGVTARLYGTSSFALTASFIDGGFY